MQAGDKLRTLVGQLTARPAADVQLSAWPTHYGLDSLSILVFREQCESEFRISIPDDDWAEMYSLNDVLKFVDQRRTRDQPPSLEIGSPGVLRSSTNANAFQSAVYQNVDDMSERLEIGMPLTGVNGLSENALLKHLGDLRWRHIAQFSGVPSRDLADGMGNRLYPTFFYVESLFPHDAPMASFGENDVVEIVDTVRRYGLSILDGVAFLISPKRRSQITRPLEGLTDAVALGIPAVRLSNIFVMQFNGAEWLKKGRPKDEFIKGIRELPEAPDSYAVLKQVEQNGYLILPDAGAVPLRETPYEYNYQIQPDRDVNGVGLLYFANYPVFLDLAERAALKALDKPWPDEITSKRSILNRKIAYLNNASWRDALKIATRSWVKTNAVSASDGGGAGTIHLFSNQNMYRVSDGRLMCVSSSHKILYGVSYADFEKGTGISVHSASKVASQ